MAESAANGQTNDNGNCQTINGNNFPSCGTFERPRKREIWYHVLRDDRIFQDLLGQWDPNNTKEYSKPDWIHLTETDWSDNPLANETKPIEVESFRSLAAPLPFSIKFILELHIFNNIIINVQQSVPPRDASEEELEARKQEIAKPARRMLLGLIQKVVPTLLEMEWETDVDNITLKELFAREIEASLIRVKKAVSDGRRQIEFDKVTVNEAMQAAYDKLIRAEELVGKTEEALATANSNNLHIDIIRKRARWPYAEYSCRFFFGHLVPTELEIINESGTSVGADSRRGLREGGWMVRDRFCRVTNVFHSGEGLIDWIASEPIVCGRRYKLLFDKGVGTGMKIWMLSNHAKGDSKNWPDLEVTRDSFLLELGWFEEVSESKLGDRIGLAFSQTMPIDILREDKVKQIPEIFRNGYAFSDGCGVMGLNVALKIRAQWGLRDIPGAVQIRIGGVKGMLSLDTDFDANSIGIRPSMIKFPSKHRVLEVKRVAGGFARDPDSIFTDKIFNQALLVLHHLGVPCQDFFKLYNRACAGFALEHDDMCESPADALDNPTKYIERVFGNGRKSNGERFSLPELTAIKEQMITCKDRVNLPARVKVMFGIIDESGELEEGEVLVCNGLITGDVLVFRSPCLFPGDIQKVRAAPRKGSQHPNYSFLSNVIVFSAKGERPLQDKLGGGDLDGDEYFVVYDPIIVERSITTAGHDYKTQNLGPLKETPTIFPRTHTIPVSPHISKQLRVLKKFIEKGNLVVDTAEAWIRVADVKGVGDPEAQKLAELHNQALDSRKKAFSIDRHEFEYILESWSRPHFRSGSGKREGRRSNSLLGILFELWNTCIKKVDLRIKAVEKLPVLDGEASRIDDEITLLLEDMTIIDEGFDNQIIDGQLHRYCITCNNPRGKKRCDICDDAWVCLGQCEIKHWRLCFGIQWEAGDEEDDYEESSNTGITFIGSYNKSKKSTEDTESLTSFDAAFSAVSYDDVSELNLPMECQETQEEIIETLIRIVFGQDPTPRTDSIPNINWACIDEESLVALRQCVLVDFCEGFKRDLSRARAKAKADLVDTPHIYDVFTMEPRLASDNITMAVCMRSNPAGGLLMWRDKHDISPRHPLSPPFHQYRVASLSGPSRILENLSMRSTLMDAAMRREDGYFVNAVDLSDVHVKCIPEDVASRLNPSQIRSVATVLSSRYTEGFFLVQGPPGTGKTMTLAAMIASLKEGIVLASSNAAVANIAAKLLSVSRLGVQDVVVFGDNCSESIEFLSPIHRSRRFRQFKKEFDAHQDNASLQEELAKKFRSWLHLDDSNYTQDVIEHCPYIDTDSKRGQHILSKIIGKAKVVLCTLNTAGSNFLQKAVDGRFDTLFLDEAAQCTEAEFYIATNFPGVKRMVLIGDPKQLNATVLHNDLKDLGYGNSFMTNVMESRRDVAHLLGIQYRCDPAIMAFSNLNFYSNKLLTAKSVCNRKPKVSNPLLFINTGSVESDQGKEERYGQSWRNPFEAQAVKRLLLNDKDVCVVRSELKHATTMVITPYRAQVNLIAKQLSHDNLLTNVKINTVDSFQGQEADIVIFSAVRTKEEGFVNDEQRINVALTRAKRVLRVVGDYTFWSRSSPSSPMKRLVEYCNASRIVKSDEKLGKRAAAFLKPSWDGIDRFTWKPTMVSRFHHSLRDLSKLDTNIALNTLLAVCMPDEKSLALPVNTKAPCWQQSALKGCEERVQIMWVAKEGANDKPKIEAHFAGSKDACNKYRQTHPLLPKGTVQVKKGLAGVSRDALVAVDASEQSQNIDIAWTLKENLGNAIVDGELSDLPDGYFDLDPDQTDICAKAPPLLIESGSGTGKTNVLFKHAVDYAYQLARRLRRELEKRYNDIALIERVSLPDVRFFSLRELLDGLLKMIGSNITMQSACTFRQHVNNRTAYGDLTVDISEAENEISGVILGSLESALKQGPLERSEYIESKRSNIDRSSQDGLAKRHLVYDEYQKYHKWKRGEERLDKEDVILELIRNKKRLLSKKNPLFDAVYLDEIQDFTYASIYLICSIAGRPELRWTCAGDTAQMISPGCSFKFDGLKQTMLAVQPGIESKIKSVVKLAKNYRVTKDVLVVSNGILMEAKRFFKDSIEYARPEIAVKDLGTRVLWCDWDDALKESPKFGINQALIFTSTHDIEMTFADMKQWLNSHPFILTTLDSKGLEFEDVVVAFDVDRKSWAVSEGQVSSLRLLRELYVAVTRAKRRVVILIKKNVMTMKEFFVNLEGCNIVETDAKTAFLEFDSTTSSEEWFDLGMKHFGEENYKMAAACFKAGEKFPHFHWAQGEFEIGEGFRDNGKESLRKAARAFFEDGKHELTLRLLSRVMDFGWDSADDYIYEKSKLACPSFFTPEQVIKFALSRDKWSEISIENLKSKSTATLFVEHRRNPHLVEKISTCTEQDRSIIERALPLVVGDWCCTREEYPKAVQLYLDADTPDVREAERATNSVIQMRNSTTKADMLTEIAEIWMDITAGSSKASSNVTNDSDSFMLLSLFESPSKTPRPVVAFEKFGRDVVMAAFVNSGTPMESLHNFSPIAFQDEIRQALESKYDNKCMEAIRWYLSRNDETNAAAFAMDHVQGLENDELLAVIRLNLALKGIPKESARRGIQFQLRLIIDCLDNSGNVDLAVDVTTEALSNKALSVVDGQKRAIVQDLMSAWDSDENYQSIKTKLSARRRSQKPSRAITFLRLLFEPDQCNAQTRSSCMQMFGKQLVEDVVSRKFKNVRERYNVLEKFDKEAFIHLRPKPTPKQDTNPTSKQNTKQKQTISTPKPSAIATLKKDDTVLIRGIKQKPELNMRKGKILKYNADTDRYAVSIPTRDPKKPLQVKLKPENLERVVPKSVQTPSSNNDDSSSSDSSNPPSLNSRDRSASSSSSDEDSISSGKSSSINVGSQDPDEDSDSDGSIPPLTNRNDSSSDESMPHINQRNVSSSSSNDSRDSRLF